MIDENNITEQHIHDACERFVNLTDTVNPEAMFVLWLVMGHQLIDFVQQVQVKDGAEKTDVHKFFKMAAKTIEDMHENCEIEQCDIHPKPFSIH